MIKSTITAKATVSKALSELCVCTGDGFLYTDYTANKETKFLIQAEKTLDNLINQITTQGAEGLTRLMDICLHDLEMLLSKYGFQGCFDKTFFDEVGNPLDYFVAYPGIIRHYPVVYHMALSCRMAKIWNGRTMSHVPHVPFGTISQ